MYMMLMTETKSPQRGHTITHAKVITSTGIPVEVKKASE
jgi:hypothetical protein